MSVPRAPVERFLIPRDRCNINEISPFCKKIRAPRKFRLTASQKWATNEASGYPDTLKGAFDEESHCNGCTSRNSRVAVRGYARQRVPPQLAGSEAASETSPPPQAGSAVGRTLTATAVASTGSAVRAHSPESCTTSWRDMTVGTGHGSNGARSVLVKERTCRPIPHEHIVEWVINRVCISWAAAAILGIAIGAAMPPVGVAVGGACLLFRTYKFLQKKIIW